MAATSSLEMMLGDTAVAIHSQDERYNHLHDKHVSHPFSQHRIPIICDDVLVDINLGTDAEKITQAHDFYYECGKINNLEFICTLTENGAINANGGKEFEGMMRHDARIAVEKVLKEKVGLFCFILFVFCVCWDTGNKHVSSVYTCKYHDLCIMSHSLTTFKHLRMPTKKSNWVWRVHMGTSTLGGREGLHRKIICCESANVSYYLTNLRIFNANNPFIYFI